MIEINLVPGSGKKRKRTIGLPKFGGGGGGGGPKLPALGGPGVDRMMLFLVGGWVVGLALVAYLHLTTSARLSELNESLTLAQEDSARLRDKRAQMDTLQEQEKLIGAKLQIIQEIDAGRFTYAHIFDEVSAALPPYVWLVTLTEAFTEGTLPRIKIVGNAGNYFALGGYIERLEASPFIKDVRLLSSSRTLVDARNVLNFVIELGYQEPPPDAIRTVPLFAAQQEN